jgi:flagellar basal body-associated protein FliL
MMPSHYNDKDDDDPKQLRRKSAVRRFRNTLCTSCWNVCNRRTNKSKQPQRQQLPLHSRSLEHHSSSSSSNTSSSNTTKQSIRVLPQLFLLVLFAVVMTNISLLCLQQFHIYNYYLNPDDLQAFSYRLERDLQFQLASQEAALVVKYQVQHEQAQEQQKQQTQRHLSLFSSSTNSCAHQKGFIFVTLQGSTIHNLLQLVLANRMARELCWKLILQASPTNHHNNLIADERAQECFPWALMYSMKFNNASLSKDDASAFAQLRLEEFSHGYWKNDHPQHFVQTLSQPQSKLIYKQWVNQSISHGITVPIVSPYDGGTYRPTQQQVDYIRQQENIHAVLLSGKNIHTRQLYDIMTIPQDNSHKNNHPNRIVDPIIRDDWLGMNDDCCIHRPPSTAVVIYLPHADNDDDDDNFPIHKNAYRQVLDQYYFGQEEEVTEEKKEKKKYTVWIVGEEEEEDARESSVGQFLHKNYPTKIVTGEDRWDTFCILRQAHHLVLSGGGSSVGSSTFAQLAAILTTTTTPKNNENNSPDIHYLVPHPNSKNSGTNTNIIQVVPTWKYHLLHPNHKGIKIWDVPHEQLAGNGKSMSS